MKSFLEWMDERQGTEDYAYKKIQDALDRAGIPWDQDEGEVLYGKWVDITVSGPRYTKRLKGVVMPDDFTSGHRHLDGFQIDGQKFDIQDISDVHEIRPHTSYEEIMNAYRD